MSVLVAGCGTMEAAVEAYSNPKSSVVGIDLSPASLECSEKLKKKHNLANLELFEMDLCDAPKLGRTFDLVVSFGVLHHLKDPVAGLAALAKTVKDDGLIFLYLYGKYQRQGVYRVQEAFRRMKLTQSRPDAAFACEVMNALPPWHPALSFVRDVKNPDIDIIVDTFLHPQDRAYSVPEILELAENCDLVFQGWFDNLFYYPEGTIDAAHPLFEKVSALPECEQWAVVELLSSPLFEHAFMLRKKGGATSAFYVDFEDPSLFQRIPVRRRFLKAEEEKAGLLKLSRERHEIELSGFERKLLLSIDGKKSIADIVSENAFGVWAANEKARVFFRLMWRLGHLSLTIN
jgi:SAM-dependent methyltransferase